MELAEKRYQSVQQMLTTYQCERSSEGIILENVIRSIEDCYPKSKVKHLINYFFVAYHLTVIKVILQQGSIK